MATQAEKILSVKIDAKAAIQGIQDLNNAMAANRDVMQALVAQGKQNSKEYITLAERSKQLSAEKRTLQKEVRNEIKAQTELDGSLKSMRARLSNLTKEYDSLSKAERNAGAKGKELKVEINRLTNEIKKAEEGTQRYYRNVGNYQNSILSAIGLNNQFATSLIGIAGTEKTVSGAMTAMGNSVKAFGKTLSALLTNPVFLAIAGIAGAGVAFKWWYDYNMGVAEATRLTREFTGYAGKELSDLRASIQATADTYGKEYKETLQGVDTLMSYFGMTGQEALNVINKGFQAGADLNGDMLSKLTQLAPTFKNAGMEAEQFVALLAQTRSGIFSDKGLDAISMGTSRIRQFSDGMKKALQSVGMDAEEMARKLRDGELTPFGALTAISAKLQELSPNTQEYGKVMNEVFGKAGKTISTEMVQALADMSTNLDEVKEKTGAYGEAVDALREKNEELNKAVDDLFGATGEGLDVTTTKLQILYKDGLLRVVKGLQDVVKWFKNAWNSSKALRIMVAALITSFRLLARVAFAGTMLLVNGFKTVIDVIVVLNNAFKSIASNIATAFRGLGDIFKGIINLDPDQIIKGVEKASSGTFKAITSLGNGIANATKSAYNNILNLGSGALSNFKDIMGDMVDIADFTFDEIDEMGGATGTWGGTTTTKPKGNGNGGGGGSNKGGKGGSTGNTSTSTGKSDAQKEMEKRAALAKQLIEEANRLQQQALQQQAKESINGINKLYDAERKAIIDKYAALGKLNEDEQAAYDALLRKNQDDRQKAITDFVNKQAQAELNAQKAAQDQALKMSQAALANAPEGSKAQLEWHLKVLDMEMQAELAMYEGNEQMKAIIREKYNQQAIKAQQDYANQQVQIEMSKYTAMSEISGALGELAGAFAEDSKAAAIASKTLALGQIMIAQAVAIANAIKEASMSAITPWQLIANIATSVAAVTAAMVQAFTSLDDAKFATGGYVRGAGTSTSDSIPVRVSNGESIMNANTTAMFGGLLSSLNQLGGGVPIQVAQTSSAVQGEEMLARAVARGVSMLPSPVVSVADINEGQRRVEVITERALL